MSCTHNLANLFLGLNRGSTAASATRECPARVDTIIGSMTKGSTLNFETVSHQTFSWVWCIFPLCWNSCANNEGFPMTSMPWKKKWHRHHDPHCEHGGFSSCSMLSSNEGCTISPDHHCAALRSCDLQGGQLNWAELAGIFREISLWKMRCPTHLRDTSRKIWCHVSLAKDIAIYCDVVFFPAWKMMVSCFNSTSLVHDRKDPHKY